MKMLALLLLITLTIISCSNDSEKAARLYYEGKQLLREKKIKKAKRVLLDIIKKYPENEWGKLADDELDELPPDEYFMGIELADNKEYVKSMNILNNFIDGYPQSSHVSKAKKSIRESALKYSTKFQRELSMDYSEEDLKKALSTTSIQEIVKLMNELENDYPTVLRRNHEGATKGKLGSIRSALSIYYADNEGMWPDSLAGMCSIQVDGGGASKYMMKIPVRRVGNSTPGDGLSTETSTIGDSDFGWYYNKTTGDVMVNSLTGTDTKGNRYQDW